MSKILYPAIDRLINVKISHYDCDHPKACFKHISIVKYVQNRALLLFLTAKKFVYIHIWVF